MCAFITLTTVFQDTVMTFGAHAHVIAAKVFNSLSYIKSSLIAGDTVPSLTVRRMSPQFPRIVRDVLMLLQKPLELIERVNGAWTVTCAVGVSWFVNKRAQATPGNVYDFEELFAEAGAVGSHTHTKIAVKLSRDAGQLVSMCARCADSVVNEYSAFHWRVWIWHNLRSP
jgi:hypothetical protein